ncbi:MAG: hypothetical protein GYB66_10550, partial [Chloroflexi bacterium]|nr:hypothetical protein [Chloroflexota bacterium]
PAGGVGGVSGGGPVNCATPPAGGFATIFNGDASLPTQISCPLEGAVPVTVAYQPFERGLMIWVAQVGSSGQPGIYVFFNNNTYQRFNDTWREGVDPERAGLGAPPGLQEPIRGFGKIWRETGGIRDRLGWATAGEIGDTGGTIQVFERGEMIYVPQTGQTYVAVAGTPGTWTSVAVAFR